MRESSPYDGVLDVERPRSAAPITQALGRVMGGALALLPDRATLAAAALAVCAVSGVVMLLGCELRTLVDEGLSLPDKAERLWAFVALFALIALMAIASFARSFYVALVGERVVGALQQRVYAHVLRQDISFFDDIRAGEIIARLTTDCGLIHIAVGNSLAIGLRNVLLLGGGLCMMVYTSWALTLYTFAIVPLVVVPIVMWGKRVGGFSRKAQDALAALAGYMGETLHNIRTVQAFTHEALDTKVFEHIGGQAYTAAVARNQAKAMLSMLVMLVVSGGVLLTLWAGMDAVTAGTLTPGALTAFVVYACIAAGAMGSFSDVIADIQRADGAFERIEALLKSHSTLQAPAAPRVLPTPARGIVAMHNVCFAYPSHPSRLALDRVSFSLAPGENLAIVGPSGAGKSTILSLLMRFYDPQAGSIYFDGIDTRDVTVHDLRGRIGMVGQEPALFSSTLYENILYGRPGARFEEVQHAATLAGVMRFVDDLPQGLHTRVGTHGVRLSGGQKQRVAIARAILRDPALFLLDEATNALDAENEQAVQEGLRHLTATRTTIIVAHRLATVLRCDKIVVLDGGCIQDIGNHGELVGRNALYRRLATLQFPDAVNLSRMSDKL